MFTPIETSIGALLLHQATSVLLFNNGSVLGASGLLRRLLNSPSRATLSFFAGMALSFLPLKLLLPELIPEYPPIPSTWQTALATVGVGALIGWGTKACNGCTSGHMLCGLSRLSGRSFIAVGVLFPTAILTYHLTHPSLFTDICPPGVPCYLPTYPSHATTASLLFLAAMAIATAQLVPPIVAYLTPQYTKCDPNSPARQTTQFLSGLTFGLGLLISKMSQPSKLLSFFAFPNLDAWDPSMLLVMIFGVLPNLIQNMTRGFTKPPCFGERFNLPNKTVKDIDWKFVVGAAIFGIGWGLHGICPGPAVLRSVAQPLWGLLWMSGFWAGGHFVW